MRTMVKIESYSNGILGVYDLADIDSLTHNTEKSIVNIKLVSGACFKFEDVFTVDEENLYEEGELEEINKNREMVMPNNLVAQEIYEASQNMVNTLYNSFNYAPYGYVPQPPVYSMQPNNNFK